MIRIAVPARRSAPQDPPCREGRKTAWSGSEWIKCAL